ncbi:hypothetical protein L210DRAFT_3524723 [Boletus edulis BED1]|uniref:Uncharacterized protein n=1 Tax=Boletus edulis BED1 TaxID=1328754 RepID=A0AAD4C5J4_BOLED|nr:hypothetical protein L210DRAFT_3524723 [Boletus edulis BED1]
MWVGEWASSSTTNSSASDSSAMGLSGTYVPNSSQMSSSAIAPNSLIISSAAAKRDARLSATVWCAMESANRSSGKSSEMLGTGSVSTLRASSSIRSISFCMRASTSSWNEKWPVDEVADGAWEGRDAGESARLLEHWTTSDGEDAGEQPGVQRWVTRPAGERDE